MIREIKRLGSIRQYSVGRAGIAHVRIDGDRASIVLIRLPADEQGQGIASQAYRDLGATLKAQGITLQASDSLTDSTRAIWQGLETDGLAMAAGDGWEWR
jgi:hypothetical protein